uniref:Mlh1_C domain-containing protein n=1 Tax=Mesocestoides corti TaxID=53468 RepID=A0A5K3EPX9_MESCO
LLQIVNSYLSLSKLTPLIPTCDEVVVRGSNSLLSLWPDEQRLLSKSSKSQLLPCLRLLESGKRGWSIET